MPSALTKLMKAQQYFLILYLQQPNNLMIDHDSNKLCISKSFPTKNSRVRCSQGTLQPPLFMPKSIICERLLVWHLALVKNIPNSCLESTSQVELLGLLESSFIYLYHLKFVRCVISLYFTVYLTGLWYHYSIRTPMLYSWLARETTMWDSLNVQTKIHS